MNPPQFLPLVLLGLMASSLHAEVKPNGLFSDNAVIQRGMEVPVWGSAREGENVTVEFAGQKVSTTAVNGKWMVKLPPLEANSLPQVMTITGDNVVTIANVLIGEVWLCSGQSNMGRTLVPPDSVQPRHSYWTDAAAVADYPEIRHFRVGGSALDEPTSEVTGKWEVCTPQTAPGFTAVGYFFARDLFKSLKLPVGIINSSVGATGAASWISREGLSTPELKGNLDRQEKAKAEYPAQLKAYQENEAKLKTEWAAATETAKAEGKPVPREPTPPRNPFTDAYRPAGYYNGKIAPLQPYAIRGALWYQGENNSGQSQSYPALLTTLIEGWRAAWGQGDFPFLFVQLPDYQGTPPEMRDMQLRIWKSVPNTGMVVTIDAGDAKDVHPPNKEPVGQRLAIAARGLVYGEKIETSGPVFDSLKIDGANAIASFNHVGGGLQAKNGELTGFTIAGADKKFVPAQAKIEGDTVVVSSPEVPVPVAIRYAWASVPVASLYNKEGLPATPFRSNDWR